MIKTVFGLLSFFALATIFIACSSDSNNEQDGVAFNPDIIDYSSDRDSGTEKLIAERKAQYVANQFSNSSDNYLDFDGKVKLTIMIPDDQGLSSSEMRLLESKMMQLVTANGIGGIGGNPRFIIAPLINILKKEVTSTAPARHLLQCEVAFYIADIITGNVYGTYSIEFKSVGQSDQLALSGGFQDIKSNDRGFQEFIKNSGDKIIQFYIDNADRIISEANTLTSQRKYNQAIALLESIPLEAKDAFKKANSIIADVFQKYLDNECETVLSMMKSSLGSYSEMSAAGFNPNAMGYYQMIPVGSACKPEADRIYADYIRNLNPQAIREWELAERDWHLKVAQQETDNEYRALQEEMKARIAVEGNACLLEKYKKDAAYNNLPWLRRLIHLGDYDPFDGYKANADC